MEIFGFSITRTKAAPRQLSNVDSRGGWWPIIRESWAGAWQSNVEVNLVDVLTHPTVFACVSLIASDIGKMRLKLVEQDKDGIWEEIESPSFSPLLRKPNHYQTRIKFFEQWIYSKLIHGNTYALKQRDNRGIVTALYILDPQRTRPLVAPNGDVFYAIDRDDLSQVPEDIEAIPAREIIHDVGVAFYHPLVGLSPITAAGLAAVQGLKIQTNTANLYANGANPGGILTAPGAISEATAARLKAHFEAEYSGENVGKVAVLGDGLKFQKMTINAVDAQLIEQLKWGDEKICSVYHVPAYKVGVGTQPPYNNIEALDQQYYSGCLQNPIECIELLFDEGLGLAPDKIEGRRLGTEFDLDDLLRMDTATMVDTESKKVGAGIGTPNESRRRINLKPVKGGDTPYMQQQQFSLAALDRRDQEAPPPPAGQPPQIEPIKPDEEPDPSPNEAKVFEIEFTSRLLTKANEIAAGLYVIRR